MRIYIFYPYFILLVIMCSCQNSKEKEILRLLSEWDGKEVIFPSNSVFSIQGKDTVDYHFEEAEHKVVCYVDSVGCFSCKLQLERWQAWMQEVDSISNGKVSFIFYFQTKNLREMQSLTRRHDFKHPLLVTDVVTSCSCTTVAFPKEAIAPGKRPH